MLLYQLIKPDGTTLELTQDVLRGLNNIDESVFDLDSAVLPDDVTLTLANNSGAYSADVQTFRDFDLNQLLIQIVDHESTPIYTGVVSDIKYNLNEASVKVVNIVSQILTATVKSYQKEGSPSEVVRHLLFSLGVSELLIDETSFAQANFIFDSLILLESLYPTAIDAATGTVNWATLSQVLDEDTQLIKYAYVGGAHVYKPKSYQRIKVVITEETDAIDILKEVSAITGLQIFGSRGILHASIYPFGQAFYEDPKTISTDFVKENTVQLDRPLQYRVQTALVPYDAGTTIEKASLTFSNLTVSNSEFLQGVFAAKPLDLDGLDGAIYHVDLASASNALETIMLLRGPARWHLKFQYTLPVEAAEVEINAVKLFQPAQIVLPDSVIKGLPIEYRRSDDNVQLRLMAANEGYIFRDEVLTQIAAYEALGNQSLYPPKSSSLKFPGLSVNTSQVFAHRSNRANPAFVKVNENLLVLINNTINKVRLTYAISAVETTVELDPDEFHEINSSALSLDYLTVTVVTDLGEFSETYLDTRPLTLALANNLLLTNYLPVLLNDYSGVIPQP